MDGGVRGRGSRERLWGAVGVGGLGVGLELGQGAPLRTVAVHPSPKQPTIVISLEHGSG